ncbi:MAG: flagellar basal body rod protein FlgB [Methylophilaceae bacterium]|nr:flagellar basal body rod protein FlgB [Methylophilaceae bacterium]
MINKLDEALGFHQTALRVRAQRQELIASNIANADTPNFKAKDIDFKAAFASAMSGPSKPSKELTQTNPAHLVANPLPMQNDLALPGDPQYRKMIEGSVDGNTVDMDVERNQFADNGIRYEASLTMINAQIKHLTSVLQG